MLRCSEKEILALLKNYATLKKKKIYFTPPHEAFLSYASCDVLILFSQNCLVTIEENKHDFKTYQDLRMSPFSPSNVNL